MNQKDARLYNQLSSLRLELKKAQERIKELEGAGPDSEAKEIMEGLPSEPWGGGYGKPANAYVYTDFSGRLAILPHGGGWLGCEARHVQGDLAPFSD
jgi:hypothetical protein